MHRFAWAVAVRYSLLSATLPQFGCPLQPGALIGGRHIGHLCAVLERYKLTPDRYTADSLAAELDDLTSTRQIPSPGDVEPRDRLAWFLWMLKRLSQLTRGETRHEAARRRADQAHERHVRQQRQRIADAADAERLRETSQDAAEVLFSFVRGRITRQRQTATQVDQSQLVRFLLGAGRQLYDVSAATQLVIGTVTQVHRALLADGWSVQCSEDRLTWRRADTSSFSLIVARAGDEIRAYVDGVAPVEVASLSLSLS